VQHHVGSADTRPSAQSMRIVPCHCGAAAWAPQGRCPCQSGSPSMQRHPASVAEANMDSVLWLEAVACDLVLPLRAQLASLPCAALVPGWPAGPATRQWRSSSPPVPTPRASSLPRAPAAYRYSWSLARASQTKGHKTVNRTRQLFIFHAHLALSFPPCSSVLPEGGQLLGRRGHSRLQAGHIICRRHHRLVQQLGDDIHLCVLQRLGLRQDDNMVVYRQMGSVASCNSCVCMRVPKSTISAACSTWLYAP
jgi:hypothetical protein